MRSLAKLILVLFCFYMLTAFADDHLQQMKLGIAKRLTKDLEVKLAQHLSSLEKRQIKPKTDFSLKLAIRLAHEVEESVPAEAAPQKMPPFIAAIDTNVLVKFVSKDPTLDMKIKTFVNQHFADKGSFKVRRLQSDLPLLQTRIIFPMNLTASANEVRRDFVLVTITVAILLVLFLLNSIGAQRVIKVKTKKKSPIVPLKPRDLPIMTQNSTMISEAESPRLRRHPTQKLLEFKETFSCAPVDPQSGSWYLHALPEVPVETLQGAFHAMPFDEAVLMLRSVNRLYRTDVIQRLDLMPAVRTQLES